VPGLFAFGFSLSIIIISTVYVVCLIAPAMSSDAVQLGRVEVLTSSQVASSKPGPTMDQSNVSAMLPGNNPINNVDAIELVALQEIGGQPEVKDEETQGARIERLGRQRPEQFKTLWAEIGFVFSIVMSQVITVSLISNRLETLISIPQTVPE
jgi:hypothetical protein